VSGLRDFPGEISSAITKMMTVDASAMGIRHIEKFYDAVFDVVYDGSLQHDDFFTPSQREMLLGFRAWLQRLETNDASANETVHILGNLNAGHFLAFIGQIE